MYILINNETMSVMYKHSAIECLANLAWMEIHNDHSYLIANVSDASCLKDYGLQDLKALYRNMTGQDAPDTIRNELLQLVWDACDAAPVADINPLELELQAGSVKEQDCGVYHYVKGSRTKSRKADLFEVTQLKSTVAKEKVSAALAGELPALKAAPAPARAVLPESAKQPQRRAPAGGAKRGTAKSLIWGIAQEWWEKRGRPTDKKDVLAMRKDIMDHLQEAEGMRRDSVSCELGQWQKTIHVK